MLDETKERLIVMGGVMEDGVFQVEIVSARINHKFIGSILTVTPVKSTMMHGCNCAHAWTLTPESKAAVEAHLGPLSDKWAAVCACDAVRID